MINTNEEVILDVLLCRDMSGDVCMFRAHTLDYYGREGS